MTTTEDLVSSLDKMAFKMSPETQGASYHPEIENPYDGPTAYDAMWAALPSKLSWRIRLLNWLSRP